VDGDGRDRVLLALLDGGQITEWGSATLLTGQLHDCAAGWKRGTQLGERGAATAR